MAEKRTITDKLAAQEIRRYVGKAVTEYERKFPFRTARNQFFTRMREIDEKLHDFLEKRPLSRAEIVSIGTKAFKALRQAMANELRDSPQPRFKAVTNIATGESHWIPDYGD